MTESNEAMEEEDFGFTERDKKVLHNVLASPVSEKATNDGGRQQVRGTGADNRDGSSELRNGDNVIKSRSRKVGGVVVVAGSAETGSEKRGKSEVIGESLVVQEPPSIPNVVEYHLKVKSTGSSASSSSSSSRSHHQPEKIGEEFNKKSQPEKKSSEKEEKKLSKELSKMALENKGLEASGELPQTFQVKYLGSHDARGLWGIKHTRKPVDNMVTAARSLPAGTILPFIKLVVSKDGVKLLPIGKKRLDAGISKSFSIDTISYGVQDLVYTRVFSMIVVREVGQNQGISPFECHGFVCESRHHARQLTYALASAFQIYSINVKAQGKAEETAGNIKKRFAIDLRSPEEIEADLTIDSEA